MERRRRTGCKLSIRRGGGREWAEGRGEKWANTGEWIGRREDERNGWREGERRRRRGGKRNVQLVQSILFYLLFCNDFSRLSRGSFLFVYQIGSFCFTRNLFYFTVYTDELDTRFDTTRADEWIDETFDTLKVACWKCMLLFIYFLYFTNIFQNDPVFIQIVGSRYLC